jgi:hypothetical protein
MSRLVVIIKLEPYRVFCKVQTESLHTRNTNDISFSLQSEMPNIVTYITRHVYSTSSRLFPVGYLPFTATV